MKRLAIKEVGKCIGCYSCMLACARYVFHDTNPLNSALCVSFNGSQPMINICRSCQDTPCAGVCPTGALSMAYLGGINFDPNSCNSCAECIKVCTSQTLKWQHEYKQPLVCTQCGYCVEYCPRNVLFLEDVNDEAFTH